MAERRRPAARSGWQVPGADAARRAGPDADPHAVARAIALRQLTMAPRSRSQLAEAMTKRDVPDDVASAVLDRLTEVGLVDDDAYAAGLVRSKQQTRGLARRALAHELRTKGVEDDTATAALATIDPDQERATARALVDRRLPSMLGLDRDRRMTRLAGMLARKGYPGDMSYAVIREALDAEGAGGDTGAPGIRGRP